jgi:hypothetical protein
VRVVLLLGVSICLGLLLLTACGPVPTATTLAILPSPTPTSEPTATPTSTDLPTPTSTSTPTATPTSTPTSTPSSAPTDTPVPLTPTPTRTATKTRIPPTPTPTLDLTTLGEPAEPFPWEGSDPPGFLAYNDQDFYVDQRVLHGRTVTIAWEKSAKVTQSLRREVTRFYFQTFIRWWEIFGGFPYPSYTVVLKSRSPLGFGEKGIGYEGVAADYVSGYPQRVAHEVFHAWVGNALQDVEEQKYDDGVWFREGITQYYGDRGAGATHYRELMSGHWRTYKFEILGTQYDIPLTDMPAKGQQLGEDTGGTNRHYRLNVYWKGALVAYMIDLRLKTHGLTLDDFLRYMYMTYALERRQFTTQDAIQALNTISAEDWSDFFARYVYGTEELPLDGRFEYLQH